MFGIGTGEMILFGILAAIVFGRRMPRVISILRESIKAFRAGMEELRRRNDRNQPPRITSIELVTEQRDTTMKERWKKFLWSPAFWATLGVFGCATGLYFQGVANNGSGLWCLGLVFLGAAYIEKNP
jgi:Sec-independent protein translocase protein TatA